MQKLPLRGETTKKRVARSARTDLLAVAYLVGAGRSGGGICGFVQLDEDAQWRCTGWGCALFWLSLISTVAMLVAGAMQCSAECQEQPCFAMFLGCWVLLGVSFALCVCTNRCRPLDDDDDGMHAPFTAEEEAAWQRFNAEQQGKGDGAGDVVASVGVGVEGVKKRKNDDGDDNDDDKGAASR